MLAYLRPSATAMQQHLRQLHAANRLQGSHRLLRVVSRAPDVHKLCRRALTVQASSLTPASLAAVPWLCYVSNQSLSSNGTTLAPPLPDAIMILGGGLNDNGSLPEWVQRRLDTGSGLYQHYGARCPIVCLGGGTPHKPDVLQASGHVLHEATACAAYLMGRDVPASHILKEVSSYDTVGNAYFSCAIHAIPAGWRRIAVVTSNFHTPRTEAVFEDVYALAGDSLYGDSHRFELSFFAASDDGVFPPEVLQARAAKEAASTASWRSKRSEWQSFTDFHRWLHDDHLCYAVAKQHKFGRVETLSKELLRSY